MAAPSYYDNSTNTISDGTSVDASDVEDKCDDIASSFSDVADDMDDAVRFTNADFSDQTIGTNAAGRAGKVLSFDSNGNATIQALTGAQFLDWSWTKITADPGPMSVTTGYLVDASGGSFTLSFPASPSDGQWIWCKFDEYASDNPITLDGNGNSIKDSLDSVDMNHVDLIFVFNAATSTWWW